MAALFWIPNIASAATINDPTGVGIYDFDFYFKTDTFNALQSELQSQVWWWTGNSVAYPLGEFKTALGSSQGYPNNWCNAINTNSCGTSAPLFATGIVDSSRFLATVTSGQQGLGRDNVYTFAFATVNSFIPPVPLPAALPLMLMGIFGIGIWRRFSFRG